jgi:hypothetical protein
MMMPPTPTAHFVIAHPEVLFPVLETGFDGPAHPAEPHQRGQWGIDRGVAQIRLQLAGQEVASYHQPHLRAGQAPAHRDDPQRGKAGDQWPFAPLLDRLLCPAVRRQRRGIVKLTQKIARLCSEERTIEDFGLSRALYFRSSHPLSFPQGEGVWERFFINLTMPVTDFDAQGQGLIAVELDGQLVQVLGILRPEELSIGVRVRRGGRVRIEEVDAVRNRCLVSSLTP